MTHNKSIYANGWLLAFSFFLVLTCVSGCGRLNQVEDYSQALHSVLPLHSIRIYIDEKAFSYDSQNIRDFLIINEDDPRKTEIKYYIEVDRSGYRYIRFYAPWPSTNQIKEADMHVMNLFPVHFSIRYKDNQLFFDCTLKYQPSQLPFGHLSNDCLCIYELRCGKKVYPDPDKPNSDDITLRLGIRGNELYLR